MLKKIKNRVLFILLTLLFACSDSMTKEEYLEWMKSSDNPLVVSQKFGDGNIQVRYYSAQMMRMLNAGFLDSIDNSIEYYLVEFSDSINAKNVDLLHYLSYKMETDIWVSYQDTLNHPVMYHFERSYDLGNKRRVLVAFEKPKLEVDRELVFNALYFGEGPIRFVFKSESIKTIPKLK